MRFPLPNRARRYRTTIAAQFQRDMNLGLPLKANVRHVFIGDDTAQIVVDCSIDGRGPDGKNVHLGGSASDIVRLQWSRCQIEAHGGAGSQLDRSSPRLCFPSTSAENDAATYKSDAGNDLRSDTRRVKDNPVLL
jgi:hypothetical protein